MKIGFFSMLTVLFIGLKLTGYIAWSWWWVLAPIWIPLLLAVIVGGILFYMKGTEWKFKIPK